MDGHPPWCTVPCRGICTSFYSPTQMQKITISFKSFNHSAIENSVLYIRETVALMAVSPLWKAHPLPLVRRKCTLLRSPHVHKKSREQFEWCRRKAEIVIHMESRKHLLFLLFFLRNSRFPGCELKITLYHRSPLLAGGRRGEGLAAGQCAGQGG